MKEQFMGTFYGYDLVLKVDKDTQIDFVKLYGQWLRSQEEAAVSRYVYELELSNMKKRTLLGKIIKYFTK